MQSEEPLKRITINIFEADYRWFMENIGEGYQIWIRDAIHDTIQQAKEEYDDERS